MLIAAVLTAVAVVAIGIGSAMPGHRGGCDPKRSRTVIETDDARVFTRAVRGKDRLYGCWHDDGERYLLRSRYGGDARVALAGRFVAYEWLAEDGSFELRIFDLRRGRLRVVASYPNTLGYEIGSFVLNDRGSVAWIVIDSRGRPAPATVSVHRHDSRGLAQLDRAENIDPRSLAIDADTTVAGDDLVYWLRTGPHAARWDTLR